VALAAPWAAMPVVVADDDRSLVAVKRLVEGDGVLRPAPP